MIKFNKLGLIVFYIVISFVSVHALTDSNPSNNVLSINVTVVDTRNITVFYIPIDNITATDFIKTKLDYSNFTESVFPLADDGLTSNSTEEIINVPQDPTLSDTQIANLFDEIETKANVAELQYATGIVSRGWIEDRLNKSATGLMYFGHPGAILAEAGQIKTSTHELAHHKPFIVCDESSQADWNEIDSIPGVECPNGDDPDIAGRQLKTVCSDNNGCPTTTFSKLFTFDNINDTTTLRNFMGGSDDPNIEGFRSWVSNETYDIILQELSGTRKRGLISIIIRFLIFENGTIEFRNSYVSEGLFETTQQDFVITDGNYSIRALNSTNITQNITFDSTFKILGDSGVFNTSVVPMFVVLPYSNDLEKIDILKNNISIKERNKSANTPILSINTSLQNTLISNNFTLAYNSSDADGDTINYAILISSDNGSTYSTLEIDHPNETFAVNTSGFIESNQYKVKILATDGINTNTTVSEGVFEIDNDLRITNLTTLHENQTKRTFFYVANNTLGNTLNNIKEELDTGETTVELTTNHSLAPEEDIMVFIEYNYSSGGDKTVTATAISGSYIETESTSISIPHVEVRNLTVLDQSETERIFEVIIVNNLLISLTNVNWTFDSKNSNVINSTSTVILQPNEEMFIYIDYNFTTTGTFNVNATAKNGTLIDSRNLTITIS